MQITQVSYKRIFNLGNYENVAIELVAEVQENENETPDLVLDELAKEVREWAATRKNK